MSININHSLIERMRKKAQKNKCRFHVIVAGFNKKDELLGVIDNQQRMEKEGGSYHAEIRALIKWGERLKTIVLVRFTGKNCCKISKIDCCSTCNSVLTELHINVIVYTGE